MIFTIFAIYWVCISILAIKINLNTFKKLKTYNTVKIQNPEWQGLLRKDFAQWHKNKIILGSFTLLPIRFLAEASFLVGALMFAVVICSLKDGQFKQKIVKACVWYFNNYGKLMNNIAIKIEDNCPKKQDSIIKTPIIISNHSCWFDTFYITLKYAPVSFVAKYEIQFWPVIGPCARAIGCIFVKRQSENDRQMTKQLIKQRISDFYQGVSLASPLVIYPEGTTSNNRAILNFKVGAFENLSPITIFCFRYECEDFLMGEDEIEQSQHIFLMLSQRNKLMVTKIEVSAEANETPQQYMERCRDIMSSTLKFPKINAGYRDRLEIQKLRNGNKKEK